MLNDTHDPTLTSWVPGANAPGGDFPIQNLPWASFRRGATESFRGGVAIGESVVDLRALLAAAMPADALEREALTLAAAPECNAFMAAGPAHWHALRAALSRGLRTGAAERGAWQGALVARAGLEYALPARVGDYTDFYASVYHATAVGRMFRPDNPLLPNYKWVPIGYHGRSSSLRVGPQQLRRPVGQRASSGGAPPTLGPSRRLDYELELGLFIGTGNALGEPIDIAEAASHVFGMVLLNDWSARDLQAWEYQPLGPFLAKNFATTLSPWIVSLEALAPYRVPWTRPPDDPQPLAYLEHAAERAAGAIDIRLEVLLRTEAMRRAGTPAHRLSLGSFRHAYWTLAQLVAHHTVNGCNLAPGDLLGTGTLSGPEPESAGSLLELSHGGNSPLVLPGGEQRTFLEDGDEVIMRGWCERPGAARIGFGEVSGTIGPARLRDA